MIKAIDIYSRMEVKRLVDVAATFPVVPLPGTWHLISVYTEPHAEMLVPESVIRLKRLGLDESLSLRFSDIVDVADYERRKVEYPSYVNLFDTTHAKQVVDFLLRIQARPGPEGLFVHCDAGISRSGAIGTFARQLFNLDIEKFLKRNPQIQPNEYVLKLLHAELDSRGGAV